MSAMPNKIDAANCSVRHEPCLPTSAFPLTPHVSRRTPQSQSSSVRPNPHTLKKIVFLTLSVAIYCGAYADDEKAKSIAAPTHELASIQQEFKDSEAAYVKATESLPDTSEGNAKREALWNQVDKKQADLFMMAVDLAKTRPKSEVGFTALEWVLKSIRAYYLPAGPVGFNLMAQQYAANPRIGTVIAVLAYYFPPEEEPSYRPALELLNAVAEKNPDRIARGQAVLGLAWIAKRKFLEAESQPKPDTDRFAAEAEKAFDVVLREYGDCQNLRTVGLRPATSTLSGEAEPELYELRHLRIGHVAPETEGHDLDGKPFNLRDYRGKVVFFVFWASWCGPCMAAVPREKELVQRFKERPFALIGVNGDALKKDAAKAVADTQIPWRSFWNGEKGAGGPIALAWNVRAWPAVFILDHQGVIRLKGGGWHEAVLEELVSAAEK
jgi:thiol-disulfide isomerase/thioredoxin